LVGPRHRPLLLTSALISVLTILVCDLLARSIAAPIDLPIGFLTSLIGAPVLIFILARTAND
jgi:iron complex transport system permease protein